MLTDRGVMVLCTVWILVVLGLVLTFCPELLSY